MGKYKPLQSFASLINWRYLRSTLYNLCFGLEEQSPDARYGQELLALVVSKASNDPFGSWLHSLRYSFGYVIHLPSLFDFFEQKCPWYIDWFELYIHCLDGLLKTAGPDAAFQQWEHIERARENLLNPQKSIAKTKYINRWLVRILRTFPVSLRLQDPEKAASFRSHIVDNLTFLLKIGADPHTSSYRLNGRWYSPTVCAEDLGITAIWIEALKNSSIDVDAFIQEERLAGLDVLWNGFQDGVWHCHGPPQCRGCISYGVIDYTRVNGRLFWLSCFCQTGYYFETQDFGTVPDQLRRLGIEETPSTFLSDGIPSIT